MVGKRMRIHAGSYRSYCTSVDGKSLSTCWGSYAFGGFGPSAVFSFFLGNLSFRHFRDLHEQEHPDSRPRVLSDCSPVSPAHPYRNSRRTPRSPCSPHKKRRNSALANRTTALPCYASEWTVSGLPGDMVFASTVDPP